MLLDDDGRLLCAKTRYRPGWGVPGGFCDPGEDPLESAARELVEETGLRLEHPLIYGGVVDGPMRFHRTHFAVGALPTTGPVLRPPRPLEISALAWHRPGDAVKWQMAMNLWFSQAEPILWSEGGRWQVRGLA